MRAKRSEARREAQLFFSFPTPGDRVLVFRYMSGLGTKGVHTVDAPLRRCLGLRLNLSKQVPGDKGRRRIPAGARRVDEF